MASLSNCFTVRTPRRKDRFSLWTMLSLLVNLYWGFSKSWLSYKQLLFCPRTVIDIQGNYSLDFFNYGASLGKPEANN